MCIAYLWAPSSNDVDFIFLTICLAVHTFTYTNNNNSNVRANPFWAVGVTLVNTYNLQLFIIIYND